MMYFLSLCSGYQLLYFEIPIWPLGDLVRVGFGTLSKDLGYWFALVSYSSRAERAIKYVNAKQPFGICNASKQSLKQGW